MIAQFITNPFPVWDDIRSRLSDDYGGLETNGRFIGVFDDERLAAAFLIKPWNDHCYEIHGGVHPDYFGQGVEICGLMGRAIFAGTPCLKIVAVIPEFNKLMRRCVQKCGMKQEGVIKKAFLKWMRMHDLYVYGMTKSEVKLERKEICHQQQ